LTDVSQILTQSGAHGAPQHGAVVCKRNRVKISSRLSTIYKHDRQTDRQNVTLTPIGEIAFSNIT